MAYRKYTAIVTVSLVSPEGEVLGTKTEDVSLKINPRHFPDNQEADKYMKSELGTMLGAGAHNIEDCFN